MDSALNVAKKINYSNRIVTLQGEVINVGGALTGGSTFQKNSSIISRKRELENLTEAIKDTNEKIAQLNSKHSEIVQGFNELDERILSTREEIHTKNIDVTKLKEKIISVENEIKRNNDYFALSEKEIAEKSKKNEDILKKIDELEVQIQTSVQEEIDNRNALSQLDNNISDSRSVLNDQKQEITELRILKAQIDEKVSTKAKTLIRINDEIKNNSIKTESIHKDIQTAKEQIKSNSISISKNTSEIERLLSLLSKMEEEFTSYDNLRLELKSSIKLLEATLEDKELIFKKHEDQLHKLDLTKTRYELEYESALKRLNEEMELTLAEAQERAEKIEDIEVLRKRIKKLKDEISSLGNVNVGSIEEFKEISEKFTFMSDQQKDLVNAKEELQNVISEMTHKMRTLFVDNFKVLRNNFNNTFKELFKGGSGDLILTEGDELTANIDINVQPPGKKLQNINLMSGGEKVLSAIALLFAILKMKPTPFCILDEIEAALDDSNVYRYAEFMRSFSEKVQFIVITHRKGTMEASDILYGITMEEKGISKIISLDLTKN